MTVAVANRINDLQSVLRTTEDHSLTQLQEIGQEVDTWKTKVLYCGVGVDPNVFIIQKNFSVVLTHVI